MNELLSSPIGSRQLNSEDLAALNDAMEALEKSYFLNRIINFLGQKFVSVSQHLPEEMRDMASDLARRAVEAGMAAAMSSVQGEQQPASNFLHNAAVAVTGAVGGLFGLAALPIELPASTVIMLRAIADIARAEGEDMTNPETAFACLEVFALGGRTPEDDHLDGFYFSARIGLTLGLTQGGGLTFAQGLVDMASPKVVAFMAQVANRYGVALSQKMVAQAAPVIGIVGGAGINLLFIHHLEQIAQGHFTVRRLERKYGADIVRNEYDRLRRDLLGPPPERAEA